MSVPNVQYLIDLTGEPTGIRLMLPARTQLVANPALEQLEAILEREAYLYVQRQGKHQLPYAEYQRARELGIELPEAEPVYQVGLLSEDEYGIDPVEVNKPKDLDLSKCYRFDEECDDDDQSGQSNTHLLGALGKFDGPFIPVWINRRYDGYSWADLPKVTKVTVRAGKVIHEDWLWSGNLVCVETLKVTARASNGKVFSSDICMAIRPPQASKGKQPNYCEAEIYVTPEARIRLNDTEVWHHLGGFNYEGDTWDTQQCEFSRELDRFWAQVLGPDEPLRQHLVDATDDMDHNWRTVTIRSDGRVTIQFKNGKKKNLLPPHPPQPPEVPKSPEPPESQGA